jgi:hypothetical protein
MARASLNLLVAISLLLSGTFPAAIRHTHGGGADLSHHHHDGSPGGYLELDDDDDVADDDHHGNGAGTGCSDLGPAGCISHLHLEWLGLRLTLPDDDDVGPPRGQSNHRPPDLVFLQAGRDGNLTPTVDLLGSRLAHEPYHSGVSIDAAETAVAVRLICCAPTVVLLCDIARHERSGTQLI